MRPAWYLDWSDETCVIVASGPSALGVKLDRAKDKAKFIAVNNSWKLAPWADVLYACDHAWWHENNGVPEFDGIRIAGDRRAYQDAYADYYVDVKRIDRLVMEPGVVGRIGGASGAQALNLAMQFGARKIILVGFDCSLDRGIHWHGPHTGLGNPSQSLVGIWRNALDRLADQIAGMGVMVVNASQQSELRAYEKKAFEDLFGE